MDTNTKAIIATRQRGAYRHHPLALKRAIVEETLQPGASVARIARQHGVNANQVFLWRKAYREGLLPETKPTLLPVTIAPSLVSNQLLAPNRSADTGCLTVEIGHTRSALKVAQTPRRYDWFLPSCSRDDRSAQRHPDLARRRRHRHAPWL